MDQRQKAIYGETPRQKTERKKAERAEKARRSIRNRIKTSKGDGQDRDASSVSMPSSCTPEDQENLIYVGGNYMGSPDYQESYNQWFHEELVERWLRSLPRR